MKRPTILINLSGGLDSTYTAYTLLKENPDKQFLFFHLILINQEKRHEAEIKAVQNVLKYFKENGLNNFEYIESTFDYGDLSRVTIKDIQIVAMFNAIILKSPKWSKIDEIPLCWHKGEVNLAGEKGQRVLTMFKTLEVERPIKLTFPIEHLTRRQMIDNMPKELLNFVTSCRNKDKDNNTCGTCSACEQYKKEHLKPL